MKNEYKLVVFMSCLSLVFITVFIFCFYDSSLSIYYTYQVGIYNKEENRDQKLNELKENGIEGCFYMKDDSFYVLSIISQDINQVNEHKEMFDGIVKEYYLKDGLSKENILKHIERSAND